MTPSNASSKYPHSQFRGESPKCRTISPPRMGGWTEPALFEWELTTEPWTIQHSHSGYNFVIEGQLFVESGDVVQVPAGAIGRYWAPKHACMLAIYGPGDGQLSKRLGYARVPPDNPMG